MKRIIFNLLLGTIIQLSVAQQDVKCIDFSSDSWKTLGSATVKNHDSIICTSISDGVGLAYLEGLDFENGLIECDLYSPTDRAYLGLVYRMGNFDNFECIYFQPHTSGKWDAIQYDPIFNSSATWQLFSGTDYQGTADIPTQEWFHVKIKVLDDIASVYLNHSTTSSLSVKLKHRIRSGSVGVYSYHPATFKNLKVTKYRASSTLKKETSESLKDKSYLTEWTMSAPYKYSKSHDIPSINKGITKWHIIEEENSYLINLNKHFAKTASQNTILAKVIINSTKAQCKKLYLGYSDKIRVCLNAEVLFEGDNSYIASDNYTDRGYVLEKHNTIELQLGKGVNELIMEVSEDKFGWGFIAQLSNLSGITIEKH